MAATEIAVPEHDGVPASLLRQARAAANLADPVPMTVADMVQQETSLWIVLEIAPEHASATRFPRSVLHVIALGTSTH